MSISCPLCKKPMQASVTAKQGDRVFATLVCEGPHGDTSATMDPRVRRRPFGLERESKPL